jgi:phage-related baseplate assembly protein
MASLPEVVSTAIATVKPLGIRLNVRMAKRKSVDLTATLTLREGTTADTARTVEAQARIFLNRYLNSFTIGSSVSIQEMEAQMKYASDTIVGVTINNLSVDRKSIPNTDYRLSDDRSYMGAGTVSIFSVIIGSSNY